jgi:hypothetical protein
VLTMLQLHQTRGRNPRRDDLVNAILVPICQVCEHPMTLASKVKRTFILPELRRSECRRCAITGTAEEVTWELEAAHQHG